MTRFPDSGNGETKGETQFNFGDSGSNQFGDNGRSGTGFDGNGLGGSGSPSSSALRGKEWIWSSGSESGGRRKGVAGLGDSASGPNQFGETSRSGTQKGSHIPEATPKYSETNAIIGEASTWGKGAYKAFNGRIFSFESSCTYTFCRHCVESGGDFNIEIKRNDDSEIEKIMVIIDNNYISIFGDTVLVHGESVQIPYNNKLIHIKKYGEHNVLNSRRGILSLMWDKNNKLSLTLHKQYPTCGLCGNFNNTPGEDINEHIASSKIPDDCPRAFSKSYEICQDGVQVYQSGEVREGPCGSQCTCQEAKWSCTEALCPGRCKVEGSSITTFDGEKYNHPGNCYFLAIHVRLCGSYNNRAEDDFMSSQNILEKTSQTFADSWEMMSCPKGKPSSCISIEKESFAESHCGILLDASGPFASCHPIVNPKPYLEECKKYTCACENSEDCLCTILGNYVKACAEKETYILGWRAGRCDQSCPSGLVFKYNVKACNSSCRSLSERDRSCDVEDVPVDGCTCPDDMYQNNEGNCVPKSECDCYINDEVMRPGNLIEIDDNKCVCQDGVLLCQIPIDLTQQTCPGGAEYVDCSDPKAQRRVDSTCSTRNMPNFDGNLPCKRGCYCPVGMVRNSKGICVFPNDCPCSFGGREYEQGSVTSVGCNKCTCLKGSWSCTQNECQATCHIYGEGHVRTFDRNSYSFDGLCQYSFVEDYCGRENGTFRILTESVPCCEDGLTCSRKIIVALQDQNVILQDGKVTAIKTTESKECELNGNAYSVHTVGLYLILKFSVGITVIWDKNTRMSVIMDPRWNGKVCGLCGNSNGDLKDDFTTRYSSVAAGALEFGNSWKTSQECSDTVTQTYPCDSNPYCKAWAVRKCEIIRDSTFRDCHNKVDPNTYYDACIEEACACDMEGKYLGFCTSVAMYAEACSAVGVCVTWRKPDLCPVYCDYYNAPGECSWHYEPCGTVTAKTCKDRVIGQKFSALLEGCYAKCPDSAPYLDENTMKCVSLSECSCFYNDVIPAGGVIQDNCGRTCYCIAGELACSVTTTATSILNTEAGVTKTPFVITSTAGSVGTTGVMDATFTSPWRLSGATGGSASTTPGAKDGITGDTSFLNAGSNAPTALQPVSEKHSTPREPSTGATSPGKSGTTGSLAGKTTRTPSSEVTPSEGTTGGENAATTGAFGENTSEASGTERI
ncbi:PREDICTED: mucin-19 [Hipposideros armiger]|uniref:Mucin-19 n=1 Tax=Hipposideros armiger TaxID=186990 RepID=A0A8B7QKT9_HIPAR|nr:PREDICTED: mucin-19 [Hipposideros armiger]